MSTRDLSRRSFLALTAAAPLATEVARAAPEQIPVGLELYSVRDELAKDLNGTVTRVARMGYQVVEFYAPYFSWTAQQAKDVRKLLDDLGIRCNSTHNGPQSFKGDGIAKAIELNQILGAKYIVMASAGRVSGIDGWREVAETLTAASEKFRGAGLHGGYHNHQLEFTSIDGKRPIEILAAGTPKDFMLQLDVGTCVEVGSDPVAWIKQNPGRIRSLHLKEWGPGPDKGYKCLFGEGVAPWKEIFAAAESVGGVEYYLIEQEGSRFPPFETAEKCLAAYKRIHG
ncbi:MAG TPA: sugar phosphate isomerase/epimerase [Bryobacteraceae bacterium]|jgi:sugar phosphate isomerase/epimerase|nr:sugar phosphate isomerase/epimerase [Bryobacteraceae bacterium]